VTHPTVPESVRLILERMTHSGFDFAGATQALPDEDLQILAEELARQFEDRFGRMGAPR
jgi:hypothetical protein